MEKQETPNSKPAKKSAANKTKAKKKSPTKKASSSKPSKISSEDFPRRTLESSLKIPEVIRDTYGSNPTTWKEIADALGVSDTNPNNRYPLWSATAYGLLIRQ